MGGGSGGSLYGSDIKGLEDKVRQRLAEAKEDVSRHVFISFDHEDMDEVNLLRTLRQQQCGLHQTKYPRKD
jgi:hypothetical protein